ncbi:winged helix-turn-helix transcriptional regulator [Halomicrobium mukohataei]|uniref:Winged helix-turn-helix transcriptional regulator n=1 Tax=Halomicrobium mukohataei TaxID=57705 RepID=A0A847TWY1_9EURY|nr:winged helix-turn-helix domain-containing protein [Halomicrobium mukohataei]NLV10542.1 winged helix-turn-helix transcriptional regulator [Halomicrobium mukohataei]
MTTDDTSDDHEDTDDDFGEDPFDDDPFDEELDDDVDVRERLEEEADRAVESFDEGIVDLLSWVLDTETRARIYVHLRQRPDSTSDEIAEGTGLYPSTVREALAELHEEGKVTRQKRESDGAGNNPYEYAAMAPSDLVTDVVDEVQSELNTVFNLDDYLAGRDDDTEDAETDPVTISVSDEADDETPDDETADSDDETAADDDE